MHCLILLLFGCFICRASVQFNLMDVLNKINTQIHAEENLIITSSLSTVQSDQVIKQPNLPKLVYSAKTSVVKPPKIYKESNLLSVVFLEPTWSLQQQQLRLLALIAGPHARSLVLLISNDYQNLRRLFGWCWAHAYQNAIFVVLDSKRLFTYTPFPRLEIFNTTLNLYFEYHYAQRNFKGYPIRFTGGLRVPRSIVFKNATGHLIVGGTFPHFLKLFASVHNATLQYVTRSENYTISDCFELIGEAQVDLCTEQFYFGGKFSLTRSLFISHVFVVVPSAGPLPLHRYLTKPFSVKLWLFLGLGFSLITIVLTFISWYHNSRWCFGVIFLDVIASALYLPFNLREFTGRTRGFLYSTLVLFGFLLTAVYLAFLSSILSTNINEDEIESIAELKKHNISILTDTIDQDLLGMHEAPNNLLERTLKVTHTTALNRLLAVDPHYAYFCIADRCSLVFELQKFMETPRVRLLNPYIYSFWPGMLIRNNTFVRYFFDVHLQRCSEAGLHKPIWRQSQNEALRLGLIKYIHTSNSTSVLPLSLEFFIVPATALVTGYALATVVLICERIIHRYGK